MFLGVRLQCANCHNHPLDRWTQDDYHGLAAVFAHLERGREVKVVARGTSLTRGPASRPGRGSPASRFLDREEDGLAVLAEWLTQPGNPYFARATVNRLWKALMGRGLVEPVDDLRATNPATNPELLDALAADFVAHDFDLRRTLPVDRDERDLRAGVPHRPRQTGPMTAITRTPWSARSAPKSSPTPWRT